MFGTKSSWRNMTSSVRNSMRRRRSNSSIGNTIKNFYIDDFVKSVDSPEEAIIVLNQLQTIIVLNQLFSSNLNLMLRIEQAITLLLWEQSKRTWSQPPAQIDSEWKQIGRALQCLLYNVLLLMLERMCSVLDPIGLIAPFSWDKMEPGRAF